MSDDQNPEFHNKRQVDVVVEGKLDFHSIEQILSKISAQRCPVLQLPLTPKTSRFGTEAALVQLISTWARQNPESELVTFLPENDSEVPERARRFVKKPIGLVAATMAKRASTIGKANVKSHLKEAVNNQLRQFWRSEHSNQMTLWGDSEEWFENSLPAMGKQVFLPCVDHHSLWQLPPLYFSNGKPRSLNDFVSLTGRLLKRVANNQIDKAKRHVPFDSDLVSGLGAILFELFDNTDRWAKKGIDGTKLDPSVRGIFIGVHTGSTEEILNSIGDVEPLVNYMQRQEFRKKRPEHIEVSVFDSGPGFAATQLGLDCSQEITPAEELAACYSCLEKGSTSSVQQHRGIGLYEVIKTISKLRGLLRLRTGRLALYRDFIESPRQSQEIEARNSLRDWETGGTSPAIMSRVEGALITFLLPV